MPTTDKFRLASGSTRPKVTSLSLPKANGATTATITDATGWNTTTGVDAVMYRRQLNTTTGKYEKIDGTQTEWVAQLTGSTLSGMVLAAGTEPASGYAADGNTVVMCAPTAQWGDDLVTGILAHANQDGSLLPVAVQTALGLGASSLNGWNALGYTFDSITYNGNRSYDCVKNGVDLTGTLSAGMRLRTTRTVAAPTQSTSLNGTTQYYSKTSPAGMTFTNNYVTGAWVKLSSYQAGTIISRRNGTQGWSLEVAATGQVQFAGFNAALSNFKSVLSYQSLPLNKWVHVTAQLDMSAITGTNLGLSTTTNFIMFDGVDVPCSSAQGGTNPTALVQAGNLEIGSANGGSVFFAGKIAQAFVSSAKITQANIRTLYSQGLTSALITANNIISAYSFSNSITDLNTTNANNLTANGSAVATNADSPFGTQADGTISSTLDYCIVTNAVFSTNTTLTVQVPEGCTIPTSGGVASVVYSSNKAPYGMADDSRFKLSAYDSTGTATNTITDRLVKYVTNNPLDNLRLTNPGTGGGTFYLSQTGQTRTMEGITASQAVGTGGLPISIVPPTNFFSTLQSVQPSLNILGVESKQWATVSAQSPSGINLFIISNTNGSSQATALRVVGS